MRPGIDVGTLERRLGKMSEDKALEREPLSKLGGYWKMLGVNQNVVSQIEFFEDGNTAQEIGLQQEAIVGLALHNVADADQFRISSDDVQLRPDVWRAQVGPSDHAENPWRALGQLEQPSGFFQRLARLNRDRCVEVVAF